MPADESSLSRNASALPCPFIPGKRAICNVELPGLWEMSIEAVAWALRQRVADPVAKLILIGLADHHNASTEVCCPSKAKLAEIAGCSESTIKRKLAWLVEQDRIEAAPRYRENGRQTSNSYKLKMAEKLGGQPDPLPPKGARRGVTAMTPPGGSPADPPILEPQQEPKEAQAPASPVDNSAHEERVKRAQQLRTIAASLRSAERPKAERREDGAKAFAPVLSGLSPCEAGVDQAEPRQEGVANACLPNAEPGKSPANGLAMKGFASGEGGKTSNVGNTERLERWVGRMRRELATVMARPPDFAAA